MHISRQVSATSQAQAVEGKHQPANVSCAALPSGGHGGVDMQTNLVGSEPEAFGLVYQDLRRDVHSTQKRCTCACAKTPPARTQGPVYCGRWPDGHCEPKIAPLALSLFAGNQELLSPPLEEPKPLSPTAAASRGWGRKAHQLGRQGPVPGQAG